MHNNNVEEQEKKDNKVRRITNLQYWIHAYDAADYYSEIRRQVVIIALIFVLRDVSGCSSYHAKRLLSSKID